MSYVQSLLPRLIFVSIVFVISIGVGVILTQESSRVPLNSGILSRAGGVFEFTWAPDSSELAFVSAQGGTSEIWRVDAEGNAPRRMTSDGLPKSDPQWAPDGSWISYVVEQDGGQGDIHAVAPDSGAVRVFANTAADERQPRWAPGGTELAYVSDAGGTPRLLVRNLEDQTTRVLTEISTRDPAWSPDGRWIAFVSNPLPEDNRRNNEDIFIVPALGGNPRLLTPGTQRYRDSAPSWAPDANRIVYASEENGYSNLYTVSVDGRARRTLTDADIDRIRPRWSPDGGTIAFVENGEFEFHVWTIPAAGGIPVQVSDRSGTNGGFGRPNARPKGAVKWSPDGNLLAFTHSDAARSSDVWVVAPGSGRRPAQVTNSMPGELRQDARFITPDTIRYPSFDGSEVGSLIYRPGRRIPDQRLPAILFFRDSMEGQVAVSWNPFIQSLVSNGYLVFAPNVRGSSGRGTSWRQSVFGLGGQADVRDALIGLDRLSADGVIDADRVGVFGAGTGGFLAAAAVARDTARFQAAVNIQGIVDLTTAASYPATAAWTRYLLGAGPIDTPLGYYERSLINYVGALRTPIVLLYGGRDPMAPLQQIEQFAVQAEVEGKWFDYRIFDLEPHGWQRWRPSSLQTALEASRALFDTHLMNRGGPLNLTRNR